MEEFRKTKQRKYANNPPGGRHQKVLVNLKETSYSLIMGYPTKEWGEPPSTGLMFCQTSAQEVLQTEPINDKTKKRNSSIIHVGDTILDAAAEAGVN